MGIYKDIQATQNLIRNGNLLNEVTTASVTDSRQVVTSLYDILKTLRAVEYTIRNDEKVSNDVYLNKIKLSIENIELGLNDFEPIADDLEKLGF